MTTVTLDNKQGHQSDDPQMTVNFGPQHPDRKSVV